MFSSNGLESFHMELSLGNMYANEVPALQISDNEFLYTIGQKI